MKSNNKKIIDEILRQLPDDEKPVDYLTKLLSISKETAYRRMNNKVPFKIDEITILAEHSNLSIDNLLNLTSGNIFPFNKDESNKKEFTDVYSELLLGDIEIMEKLLTASNIKITATLSRIPLRLLPYQSLFKLDFYHYLHSTGNSLMLNTTYSDIEIPASVNDLHKKVASYFNSLSNITCVIDSSLYSNIIQKIHYYNHLKFFSPEDLQVLQAELFASLAMYKSLMCDGKNNKSCGYRFYYSYLRIDSTIIYCEYDDNSLLQVWLYPAKPLVINDKYQIDEMRKLWIDSKIRNSTLLTKTAGIQELYIFEDAYKQISDLSLLFR